MFNNHCVADCTHYVCTWNDPLPETSFIVFFVGSWTYPHTHFESHSGPKQHPEEPLCQHHSLLVAVLTSVNYWCSLLVQCSPVLIIDVTECYCMYLCVNPDDHSRVRLEEVVGQPNSDYINANLMDVRQTRVNCSFTKLATFFFLFLHIQGYKKKNCFIAAQG